MAGQRVTPTDATWVVVATAPSRAQAEQSCAALLGQGIPCEVVADDAGGQAPHLALGQGSVRIRVPAGHADAARQVVTATVPRPRRAGPLVWAGRLLLAGAAVGAVVALLMQAL